MGEAADNTRPSFLRGLGSALWWVGTLDFILAILLLVAVAIFFGNPGEFLPFLLVMAVLMAVLWTIAFFLNGAVWYPIRRKPK